MTRRYTVLFVEDEPAMRDVVGEILETHGFDVLTATDGYEALRLLVERHVDLLFTDIVMPGLNGFQLAQQAKLIRPSLRVLYMSGYPDQAAGRHGLRYGKLMEKPIRADALVAEIHEALVN